MADKVEQISNENFFTYVVDPNPLDGDYTPPEDLFVWVNFRALPKNRSVIESGGTYASEGVHPKGVQFITATEQNGNGYVTTNFTNIGGANPTEKEAFGISNISMEYGASLVPLVKITFIDVRGAGLMNGYEYSDENGLIYNSSELATFFQLPYPIFELSVKGFYGKAVTYCLHMQKWHTSIEASTGNFKIDAEFVGYTFAFLSDVLMKYVTAITASDIGASALSNAGVISLTEFINSLGQLTRISEEFQKTSQEYLELKTINTVLFQLDKLLKTIGNPVTIDRSSEFGNPLPFPQLKVNSDQVFVRDVGLISEQSSDVHNIIVEDLEKFVKDYNDNIITKNQAKFSYLSRYKIDSFDIKTPALSYVINDSSVQLIINEVLKNDSTDSLNVVTTSTLRSRLNLTDTSTKKFYIINYGKFRKQVSDLKNEVGEKKNELERTVNKQINETLDQELGFNLTIQNVFEIILGNVEAFLQVVYDVAKEADNPNLQQQRIGLLSNVRTDVNIDDNRIYPFPAIIDSTTGDELWIGDVIDENNWSAFPEIALIREVINALVTSNNTQTKERIQNNTNGNVGNLASGWIPINPVDYASNSLATIDGLSFNGGVIPVKLAENIVSRAVASFDYTQYLEPRLNYIAQMEASYAASQISNDVYKQLLKTFDTNDFVAQVLAASGFPTNPVLDVINNINLESTQGLYVSGLNLTEYNFIIDVIGQQKKARPVELNETIDGFGKLLDDILISTNQKKFHRTLDTNTSIVKGDATDIMWNSDVYKNIEKFHKAKTTEQLNASKVYNSPVLATLEDLTVIDGQLNATVDYTSSTDKEIKFTNNARKNIAINQIKSISEVCLFATEYYKQSTVELKGYLFLTTIPLTNIKDFYGIFQLSGIYKITSIQMAWVASQFWRALEIQKGVGDPFDVLSNSNVIKTSFAVNYVTFKKEFDLLRDKTAKQLPVLTDFDVDFVKYMSDYYLNWLSNDYIDDSNISPKIPTDFIDYIASWENFYGYPSYGLTSPTPNITYNIPETSLINVTKKRAIEIYESAYYQTVDVVPNGLLPMALEIAINQHDPLGYILATANRMGAAVPLTFTEVRDRWFGTGLYVGNAQKDVPYPLEYSTTLTALEYSTYSNVVTTLFNNNPDLFLDELSKTRLMVYSRTPNRGLIRATTSLHYFEEWTRRTLSSLQYSKDIFKNNIQKDSAIYYNETLANTFLHTKNANLLAVELNYGINSQDTATWYNSVGSISAKYLIYVPISSNNGVKLEFYVERYCELTKNGINSTSADYKNYKTVYNEVKVRMLNLIDILITNPYNCIIFGSSTANSIGLSPATLTETQLTQYLTRWHETFKKIVRIGNSNGISLDNNNSSFSGTNNEFYITDKDIKIATYRYFKNLYDKWIGGSADGKLHNTCSCLGGKPRNGSLIERFHFIDRTWSHIGNRVVINPKPIMVLSKKNDINLYILIDVILKDSNFDFHVLPSWVNYRNIEDVYDMWRPHTDVEDASSGASYIAMYMAGSSKSLDIGKKSYYLNDGFDLRDYDKGNIPEGFKDRRIPSNMDELDESEKGKYNMVVFRVSFADQNQSIFTGISDLSQNEHRETAESLQAAHDAFDTKGGSKKFYKGVNLYNIFAIRSYECTVTSMGNMQIHPATYFQLDNVPFFHGAYLITKVTHKIVPHYITTEFTGRRVPRFVMPLVEQSTAYVEIPLSDTLFNPEEKNKNVVRSLNGDNADFISQGENTSFNEVGAGLATANELARGVEAANSLLDVVFGGRTHNYWILDGVTPTSLNTDIANVYNPNSPVKFKGVGMGDCYGWVKRSLKTIGVVQNAFSGVDAWTFFTGWNDTEFQYVSEEDFVNNLGGWTNESMKAAGIPDGSFIAAYYSTSPSQYRAIDRMLATGISQSKLDKLKRFRDLDTKAGVSKRKSFCDNTPMSKKLFSYKGYEATHERKDWTSSVPADGSQMPFAPVTHAMLYINGHCFHQLEYVWTRPSSTVRIIGYYPFKKKLYDKVK